MSPGEEIPYDYFIANKDKFIDVLAKHTETSAKQTSISVDEIKQYVDSRLVSPDISSKIRVVPLTEFEAGVPKEYSLLEKYEELTAKYGRENVEGRKKINEEINLWAKDNNYDLNKISETLFEEEYRRESEINFDFVLEREASSIFNTHGDDKKVIEDLMWEDLNASGYNFANLSKIAEDKGPLGVVSIVAKVIGENVEYDYFGEYIDNELEEKGIISAEEHEKRTNERFKEGGVGYTALTQGKAVCKGYATVMAEELTILKESGIPNLDGIVVLYKSSEDHAWNTIVTQNKNGTFNTTDFDPTWADAKNDFSLEGLDAIDEGHTYIKILTPEELEQLQDKIEKVRLHALKEQSEFLVGPAAYAKFGREKIDLTPQEAKTIKQYMAIRKALEAENFDKYME
ncbi:MAG: hypothetical protein KAR20_12780, partial [Candidatus Heimdallarchaeota archaeon]|nr:hypothetical protein [Candidatus Heimdallarchaeota archaeon]